MQVSIYLNEKILKRVDRLAKTERRSRSKIIETLLESSLNKAGKTSRFESLVGAWNDDRPAREIVEEIYKDRNRNRRSERVSL